MSGKSSDKPWSRFIASSSCWLFDPDGTVLEGPEGPVSHLICGGVYDWSTGLIYKGNRYFDPNLGIWLALAPLAVVQSWRKRKKGQRGALCGLALALFLVGVSGMLTGCLPPPTPTSTPPPTLTPTCTDIANATVSPTWTPTPTPTPVPPTLTPTSMTCPGRKAHPFEICPKPLHLWYNHSLSILT